MLHESETETQAQFNPRSPLFPIDTLRAAIADDDLAAERERDEIADWNYERRRALLDGEDFDES